MPILEISLVLKAGESVPANAAGRIADAASVVFGAEPGRTWVRITPVDPGLYAEDHGGPPPGVAPVFTSVLKARLQEQKALAKEARALAEAISKAVDRPVENVHLLYEAPGLGRIAFGGELLAE